MKLPTLYVIVPEDPEQMRRGIDVGVDVWATREQAVAEVGDWPGERIVEYVPRRTRRATKGRKGRKGKR